MRATAIWQVVEADLLMAAATLRRENDMPKWPELASPELAIVRHFEQLSLSAWPALKTIFFDGWIVRFSRGYTKRSNSVVPLFPGIRDMARKVDYCRQMYNERNLPTVFKLTEISGNAGLDEYLSRQDFEQKDETMVQTCRGAYLQVVASNSPAVKLYKNFGFKEAYRYCYRTKPPS